MVTAGRVRTARRRVSTSGTHRRPVDAARSIARFPELPFVEDARDLGRGSHWHDIVAWLVLIAVLLLALATYEDFGITHDEGNHVNYGKAILRLYTSLGRDWSATEAINYLYAGGYDLAGAVFAKFTELDPFVSNHLLGMLVGWMGIVASWALARRLRGPRAGLAAAVLLSLTPVYVGHMPNNPKDLPFAVGYVWSIYAIVRITAALPRFSWTNVSLFALAFGWAMGSRIGGILLGIYLLLVLTAFAGQRALYVGLEHGFRCWRHLLIRGALAWAGGWFLLLASWPWAVEQPISRPFAALTRMSGFLRHDRSVYFAGEQIRTIDYRWDYLFHYFGYKLPVVVIVLSLAGIAGLGVFVVRQLRTGGFRVDPRPALAYGLVLFAIVFPPAYAIVKKSAIYDGLRHFLFIVPMLAVAAGLAVDVMAEYVSRISRVAVAGLVSFWLGLGVHATDMVRTMIHMHPHHYVFFNSLLGGVEGAIENYDTDYYGETFREAVIATADKAWKEDPRWFLNHSYRIAGCMAGRAGRRYTPPNFEWVEDKEPFDFFAAYMRYDCHKRFKEAPEYLTISRQNGMLNLVRDARVLHGRPRGEPLERRAP